MAGDRDEDAPLRGFERPEERLRLAVFRAAGEQSNPLRVADELPIALIVEVDGAEIAADRVARTGGEAEVERAVAKLGPPALPGETDPLGEARRVRAAIDGEVNVDEPAAALQ